jgi:tripartite-type tricarboxylate transporter receptor subunit TctC
MLTSPGLPTPVVAKFNSTLNKIWKEAEIKTQLLAQGLEPMPTSISDFTKFIAEDKEKWAKVVKNSNAKIKPIASKCFDTWGM